MSIMLQMLHNALSAKPAICYLPPGIVLPVVDGGRQPTMTPPELSLRLI
ncbi:MAG: hypothetical protein ACRD8U_16160 [Pyrinomonadaceae bacterium]